MLRLPIVGAAQTDRSSYRCRTTRNQPLTSHMQPQLVARRLDFCVSVCPAYRKAVRLVATKLANSSSSKVDFRWLDIGTGSGLLASLVAAASPALTSTTEVYACEGVENVADVAAKTFDKNGRSVRLFRGRSTEMEVGRDISSRVPLVISELLGTGRFLRAVGLSARSITNCCNVVLAILPRTRTIASLMPYQQQQHCWWLCTGLRWLKLKQLQSFICS